MSSLSYQGLTAGTFNITAQERIVHGMPAGDAVLAEAERCGAQRVFIVSSASLARLTDGPLQRVQRALGARHAGTFGAVRAHSPREDVIAAALAARQAGADLLVAVGGGSAVDATKALQVCLWHGLTTPEAMEPYRAGAPAEVARTTVAPPDAIRMLSVSTTLSASEFTAMAGITDSATNTKQMFMHRLMVPRTAVLDPARSNRTARVGPRSNGSDTASMGRPTSAASTSPRYGAKPRMITSRYPPPGLLSVSWSVPGARSSMRQFPRNRTRHCRLGCVYHPTAWETGGGISVFSSEMSDSLSIRESSSASGVGSRAPSATGRSGASAESGRSPGAPGAPGATGPTGGPPRAAPGRKVYSQRICRLPAGFSA